VAGALAALRLGRRVVLTEESDWLGGQLTSQAVPPDEHPWIETQGATRSYRMLRNGIREYYRRHYPLNADARAKPLFNPGAGLVSGLCHEPRVAVAVIDELLAPYRADGSLTVLTGYEPVAAETEGDSVRAVTLRHRPSGDRIEACAPYILDATESGDLLELAGVEHVIGSESRDETGEPHAVDGPARPLDQQAFSWCFALDYLPDEDFTISEPRDYARWRDFQPDFWPARLLSWEDVNPHTLRVRRQAIFEHEDSPRGGVAEDRWCFRRIFTTAHYEPGRYASDVTLVNWPQIDYMTGPLLGVDDAARQQHLEGARQLSLSFLYWMQTEAPRLDGGIGYRGLRLRGDLLGTTPDSGGSGGGTPGALAMRPYIREARRIRAETTVLEQHLGVQARAEAGLPAGAEQYPESVGVGSYRIDLHPSTGGPDGPRTYIDIANYPFQIPLGALIPQRVENLLPANKNLGTTHITNGCYRLHPVEWNIGEAAGALAAHCLNTGSSPREVWHKASQLADFQRLLTTVLGFQLTWPEAVREIQR